jgi:hypothetical protein
VGEIVASYEREVRDLPRFEYLTNVVVELYLVRGPDCGVNAEKVPLLPSEGPFSKRFEDAVGQGCESAAASQVAKQLGWRRARCGPSISVIWRAGPRRGAAPDRRRRDLSGQEAEVPYRGQQPEHWLAAVVRRRAQEGDAGRVLRHPIERLSAGRSTAACVNVGQPFRRSINEWLPGCRIVDDKFHIMKHEPGWIELDVDHHRTGYPGHRERRGRIAIFRSSCDTILGLPDDASTPFRSLLEPCRSC